MGPAVHTHHHLTETDPEHHVQDASAPAVASGRQPITFTAPAATENPELAELEKKKTRAERFGEKLSHADSMRLRALRSVSSMLGATWCTQYVSG